MPPMSADQYTPGSTLTNGEDTYTVQDYVASPGGGQFLVVSLENNDVCGLLPVSKLTDEETPYSPAEDQPEAQDPQPGVTGAPDVTVPGDTSPSQPQDAPPAQPTVAPSNVPANAPGSPGGSSEGQSSPPSSSPSSDSSAGQSSPPSSPTP